MRKKITYTLLTLAVILICFCVLTALLALQPPPGRPNIFVGFLGYTNNGSGTPLAMFAVTNLSSSSVFRPPTYFIEMRAPAEPGGWTNYQNLVLPGPSVLHARAGDIVTIPPPTNPGPWRIYLRVYPDTIPERVVKGMAAETVRAIGIKPRYHVRWYGFHSNTIDPGK